jgi:transcriptional regulator with XRE-family HTH domain
MDNKKTPSDLIAARVRQVRTERGMTTAQLADRCADLGAPLLTAQALYKLEGQRESASRRPRPVTVDELLALALALDVAPANLVVPLDDDQPWAITETVTERAFEARQWFRGHHALARTDWRTFHNNRPDSELRKLEQLAELEEVRPDMFHRIPESEDT